MSLLQTIAPDAATGELAQIYAGIRQGFGSIPAAFQSLSPSPTLLRQMIERIGYYMQHPRLSPALLASIRMLVSTQTHCQYCIDFNAGMLINMLGWTPEQVAAAQADPAAANLPQRDKALLLFVLATTRDPQSVTGADLDTLRALDWTDTDILEAAGYGAQMVASDILLNAFKVERDF